MEGVKGGKIIFDRSSTKRIFTDKFESPGFQIEHQMNWKVDASSRSIKIDDPCKIQVLNTK